MVKGEGSGDASLVRYSFIDYGAMRTGRVFDTCLCLLLSISGRLSYNEYTGIGDRRCPLHPTLPPHLHAIDPLTQTHRVNETLTLFQPLSFLT
jgi:hypothetical protein